MMMYYATPPDPTPPLAPRAAELGAGDFAPFSIAPSIASQNGRLFRAPPPPPPAGAPWETLATTPHPFAALVDVAADSLPAVLAAVRAEFGRVAEAPRAGFWKRAEMKIDCLYGGLARSGGGVARVDDVCAGVRACADAALAAGAGAGPEDVLASALVWVERVFVLDNAAAPASILDVVFPGKNSRYGAKKPSWACILDGRAYARFAGALALAAALIELARPLSQACKAVFAARLSRPLIKFVGRLWTKTQPSGLAEQYARAVVPSAASPDRDACHRAALAHFRATAASAGSGSGSGSGSAAASAAGSAGRKRRRSRSSTPQPEPEPEHLALALDLGVADLDLPRLDVFDTFGAFDGLALGDMDIGLTPLPAQIDDAGRPRKRAKPLVIAHAVAPSAPSTPSYVTFESSGEEHATTSLYW